MRDKKINIAKNSKCGEYKYRLVSLAYKLFDKKLSGGAIIWNQKFPKVGRQLIITKFQKRKLYSSFKDGI